VLATTYPKRIVEHSCARESAGGVPLGRARRSDYCTATVSSRRTGLGPVRCWSAEEDFYQFPLFFALNRIVPTPDEALICATVDIRIVAVPLRSSPRAWGQSTPTRLESSARRRRSNSSLFAVAQPQGVDYLVTNLDRIRASA